MKKTSKLSIPLPEEMIKDLKSLDKVVVQASCSTLDPNTGLTITQAVQANAFLAFKLNLQLQTSMRP
jgi:hypothetical protein